MSDRIRHLKLSHVVLPLETSRQRCEGAHRSAEAADRDGAALRGGHHRAGSRGHGLQLLQARRRAGPVRPPRGDRRNRNRSGPVRHRPDLPDPALGGRVGRALRRRHPGDRGARRRIVGPQGPPRRPAAGQADRRPPRLLPRLQHLRGLPAGLARRDQGEGDGVAGVRHRRHQNQSGTTGLEDRSGPGGGGARTPR